MVSILIVEDDKEIQDLYRLSLNGKIEIIPAFTIQDAEEKFSLARSDIVAVVVDGCMSSDEPNTVPLVKRLRKIFDGPIIATSSIHNEKLVAAGCDFKCDKLNLPRTIQSIFGL